MSDIQVVVDGPCTWTVLLNDEPDFNIEIEAEQPISTIQIAVPGIQGPPALIPQVTVPQVTSDPVDAQPENAWLLYRAPIMSHSISQLGLTNPGEVFELSYKILDGRIIRVKMR